MIHPAGAAILAAGLLACGPNDAAAPADPPAAPLSRALLGSWETIEIEVNSESYLGGDSTLTDHIREADWGRKYGVRPAITRFTPDGKLQRTHRLRDGQTVNLIHGLWRERGDTLVIIEPSISYRYSYDLAPGGDRLELRGRVDYDRDGAADDDYRAVLRKTSNSY